MAVVSSYEILTLKSGRWETETILDDKKSAIRMAQETLDSRRLTAVKVIEEKYDEETGKSNSFLVFNKKKTLIKTTSRYTGPERRQGDEWKNVREYHKQRKKHRRRSDFVSEVGRLIIVSSLALLGLVLLAMVYLWYFGDLG